jgi:carboxypeptidase C (cathepsin A)
MRTAARSCSILVALVAVAVTSPGGARAADAASPSPAVVTRHQGVFNAVSVQYVATAGETVVPAPGGAPGAGLFTFSFVRAGAGDPSKRPVLFVFNGGPGSASIWQQLGAFGPRRLVFKDAAEPRALPPYDLQDNPDCPLDVADIVFIDPAGVGFSRLMPGARPEDFYGVDQDARATIDFITDWLTRNGRWNSPKFMIGESYGTVRAAVVARQAMGGPTAPSRRLVGLSFNGVVLLGQALDSASDAERVYVDLLPSMAATAWYHGRIDRSRPLDQVVAEARAFAGDAYLKALWAGDRLSEADRQAVAERLAVLTGLPKGLILDHDLRISAAVFEQALLKDKGLTLGAYDARDTLPALPGQGDPVGDDPAMGEYSAAFVAAFSDYLTQFLGVRMDRPYVPIAFGEVNGRWDYGEGPGRQAHANYALDLAVALRRNPQTKLFVGAGDYDLVTPMGAAEYVVAHAGIPRGQVVLHDYASGHMVYMGDANAHQLARDLRAFIASASAP